MLPLFTLQAEEHARLLHGHHDVGLMALSVLVAMLASGFALQLASLVGVADTTLSRRVALWSGSLVLGGGIWAMHFIGMLSFNLPLPVAYDPALTILSLLPAMLASLVALSLLASPRRRFHNILVSGILVGAGIGAMHYTGMFAMQLDASLHFNPIWFLVSIVVAVAMAMVALWVHYGLRSILNLSSALASVLGGICMGLAIASMHYTGMVGARFVSFGNVPTGAVNEQTFLALGIGLAILILGVAVGATNGILRYRDLNTKLQSSESRMRAVVSTAVDGIITMNDRGVIQTFNQSAEQMFGWSKREVIGRSITMLMTNTAAEEHERHLREHGETSLIRITGSGREEIARRRNGNKFPIRMAIGKTTVNTHTMLVAFVTDITEHKNIEQSLRDSEQQYRSLISNIPGVSFRCLPNRDWKMLFISDAVLNLTGHPASDFLNGTLEFNDVIHPDDSGRVFKEVMNHLKAGRNYSLRYRVIHRDGSERWVTESASATYDDNGDARWVDGVIVDITEARRRNAEFEGTVDAISRAQAVIEFDLQGRILSLNPNAEALCKQNRESLTGHDWTALFDTAEFDNQFWDTLRRGRFQGNEYTLRTPAGPRWVQASFNPILNADGNPLKVVLLASDLTERREMLKALRAAKERAEQAADAKSAFLANMSHEIRTPMNAIIGFSELLLDSPLQEQQYKQIKTVHKSARSLLHLLNDILDTAKLDRGAVELEQHDFSMRNLCEEILDIVRLQADSKNLGLVLHYEHKQNWFLGDALRVRQILLNLTSNAVKFTEKGHVALSVRQVNTDVVIDISDTGIGIAPERLQHIFAPFAQADASMSRRFGGTGLGTTIARQLATLMQGDIDVSSTPGEGSVFTITLPLPPGKEVAISEKAISSDTTRLRVLAVDDVEENIELLRIVLSKAGHQVHLARNGNEAFDSYQQHDYDLILMDVQMPGMNGLEATRLIRAFEKQNQRQRTPVIAITASVLDRDREAARQAGMDGFASKPLEWSELQVEIERLVSGDHHSLVQEAQHTSHVPDDVVINWRRAIKRWGDREVYTRALQQFVGNTHRQLHEMINNQSQTDWHAYAHKLKGAAANLGLECLQQEAEQLEYDCLNSADTLNIPARLATIKQHVHDIEIHAQTCSSDQPGKHEDSAGFDAATLASVKELIQLLSRGETNDQLSAYIGKRLAAAHRNRLKTLLDSFEFDEAAALLDEVVDHHAN